MKWAGFGRCLVFDPSSDQPFNLCRLLAGSEGTLFLGVEFELNCEPLPPPGALMCAHFATIADSLHATLVAMRHQPHGCELIDRHILECTKANLEQAKNRFFVQGDPGAVLVIEIRRDQRAAIEAEMHALEAELRATGLGYAFPVLWGDECYALMRRVKEAFDPLGVFNPGKIIDTPPMDTSLRHAPGHPTPEHATVFNFSATRGVLRAAEKCTGVGECRKFHLMGGTMCPSYMATRKERDTTRARANLLRDVLTHSTKANPWDSEAVAGVMDLCLSCKGCKSECPSNVDVARLKAEWQQHYHDAHGVPLRSRLVANFVTLMKWAATVPRLYNALVTYYVTNQLIKRLAGFAPKRSLPTLHGTTLAVWHARHANKTGLGGRATVGSELARAQSGIDGTAEARASSLAHNPYPHNAFPHGRVHLFCDEFTNYHDTTVGIKAVQLLNRLGYEVVIPRQVESGRAHFSKGLVRDAQKFAIRNVELLKDVVTARSPFIGLEPSAILGFRDEYLDLMPEHLVAAAQALAKNALLIDEFIAREADAGRITAASFTARAQAVRLHGHCHQKALSSLHPTVRMLELPANYQVSLIPSGRCGMAGSFGYEEEHFELSQQIGELVLFPAVRAAPGDTLIAAPGTSCRHQIKDATGRIALHPVEILYDALL